VFKKHLSAPLGHRKVADIVRADIRALGPDVPLHFTVSIPTGKCSGTESSQTLRWREVDSNCRSLSRNGSVSPAERELRKCEKAVSKRRQSREGPRVRIPFPPAASLFDLGIGQSAQLTMHPLMLPSRAPVADHSNPARDSPS
jgi:hypothetical protein